VSNKQRLDRAAKELGDLLAKLERGPDRPALDLSPYRTGPDRLLRFVRDVLDVGYTLQWHRDLFAQYEEGRTRLAVASCHGGGKTWAAQVLAIYACWCEEKLVLYCSASQRQVRWQGGTQLKKLLNRSPLEGEVFVYGCVPSIGAGQIIFTPVGDASSLQGYHSETGVLFIGDEFQSDDGETLTAADVVTVDDRSAIVILCNPIRHGGSAYAIFQIPDAPPKFPCPWWRRQVSAFEVVDDPAHPHILGLVTRRKIVEWQQAYGDGSPWFQSRAYARFPRSASNSLYPEHALLAALERGRTGDYVLRGRLGIGIDVAASAEGSGGDESCIAISQNGCLLDLVTWREENTMQTVASAAEILEAYGIRKHSPVSAKSNAVLRTSIGFALMTSGGCGDPLQAGHMPANILCDAIGVSKGVLDRLREMGFEVMAFTASKRCDKEQDRDRFANQRAQIADRFRTGLLRNVYAFQPAINGLDMLLEELRAYSAFTDQRGKLAVVEKDALRGVLGRSPDRLDAALMAMAGSPNVSFGGHAVGPIAF
jgi:hypothetical protein